MKTLRALGRILLLSLVTAGAYSVFAGGNLRLRIAGRERWAWRNRMVRWWAATALKIIGMKVRVRGTLPAERAYIVSNHLSYIDIPLLFSQIGCVFVAKAELRGWPVLGFLMESVGTVFVDRASKKDVVRVNALIEQSIREGKSVIVFPEGTTSPGNDVLPFKAPLLEFPAQMELPVSCVRIHYATPPGEPPAHLAVCWWGDMTFPDHFFNLLKLMRIEATVEFGAAAVKHNNRKHLAQELWLQLKQIFVPVAAQENVCRAI